MNNATIYTLDYDGLAQARTAMQDCLAGKAVKIKSLKQATAEIRPVGNSTITGQAFYKGAILAKKQYPPKGTQAVGLIWMTDEFKAWYEKVKRDQKLPTHIPESILKHFMSTRILDDQGRFKFTNLPAGEYILIANFSYEKMLAILKLLGELMFMWESIYRLKRPNCSLELYCERRDFFEKPVTIPKDGDTINVSLDKSQIMCFWCVSKEKLAL